MEKIEMESKTVEKAMDLTGKFLQKLVGQSIEEVGGLLADSVRTFRLKNRIGLLGKVDNHANRKNITQNK